MYTTLGVITKGTVIEVGGRTRQTEGQREAQPRVRILDLSLLPFLAYFLPPSLTPSLVSSNFNRLMFRSWALLPRAGRLFGESTRRCVRGREGGKGEG
jgi:hypothetical protein